MLGGMTLRSSSVVAATLLGALAAAAPEGGGSPDIPRHGEAVVLFDGRSLAQFDVFLPSTRPTEDPGHVFAVEDGAIHVSGRTMGYLITRHAYANYYLRAEFKWGEATYKPRAGQARDSGILFNVEGRDKVWPRSIEFQINEGCTGDAWLIDGAAATGKDGVRAGGAAGKYAHIDRANKGPAKNVAGYRDPANELERPHGEWNVVELVNRDGHVWFYVNGRLANEATDASPRSGKILLQSEGAEVYFRDLRLFPLEPTR